MKRPNSNRINRNLGALTLCLCLGVIGYFSFTAQATNPKKTAPVEPVRQINATLATITFPVGAPKDCHAQWTLGTQSTGWIYLGEVSGFFANKKQKCKEKAQGSCGRAEVVNLVKNNVPANQACPGGVDVYFDTRVEGKTNSRDGYCKVKLPCYCSGWSYQ